MKFNTHAKLILGTTLLAAGGCYSGAPGGADTDEASSDTDGGGESGEGGEDTEGGEGESGESGSDDDTNGSGPGDPPDPPEGCLPGSIGCECLNDECAGLSTCIDEVCTPAPPVPDVDGPNAALAGVAITLDGDINVPNELDGVSVFESLLWAQVSGPDAVLEYESSSEAIAWLPPNAADDAELTFRLTASLGGVDESGEYTLRVLPAAPVEILDKMTEVAEFGPVLMGRGLGDTWLATDLGLVTRIEDEGLMFQEDMGSRVTSISGYGDNRVLFLQPDLGRVMLFNGNNNTYSEFLSELTSGDPLGPVSSMATDSDGNVYFGCDDGRIVLYDDPDEAEPAVTLDRFTLAETPTAMAIGQHPVSPDIEDDDEGVILYYGTASGDVWQVALTAAEVIDGPEVDVPAQYVTLPGTGAVTSIRVDRNRNMWVGKGDTLYLIRRPFEGNPSVVREISTPAGLGGLAGLHSPDSDQLRWIDPTSGRVASLQTYEE
ncbi:MAG: hypothetical protein KUG77_30070 [Nannocystaceae bacterium]|nr:hypothetical protein [Nannocystaceae bacterium]